MPPPPPITAALTDDARTQPAESPRPIPPRHATPIGGSGSDPRCGRYDTGVALFLMPTQRRRHAITETPPVEAALDELREELGHERVELGGLVILGASQKVARLRAERDGRIARRRRLADRIRRREVLGDRTAADEVRRAGWARM